MSEGQARFVGEGQLGWVDSLGGKGVILPVAAGLLAISAMTAVDRFASFALALGALVPLWFGWRMGLPQALVRVVRRGRPAFRVELDDLGVRNFDRDGTPTSQLEWFEIERYHLAEHGIVLVMRLAKNGANAVFVPKAFFPKDTWAEVLALVRAKLPGSAKAHDEATALARAQRQRSWPRAILMWVLLVVMFAALYWVLRATE